MAIVNVSAYGCGESGPIPTTAKSVFFFYSCSMDNPLLLHYGRSCWYQLLWEAVGSKMEFLDMNLTKDSSLLLRAIHSLFYGWILQKIILYYGFKTPYKKIRETKKLKSIHE